MATLTGTQIKNTYDSVLKVSDNTPFTTALKAVTDGVGNASPLLLSTTGVAANSVIQASGFSLAGGTSTQFLTADGSSTTVLPQVQSDWNATSGDAFILNKPTIFDGNYNSLTNQPTLFDGNYNSLTNQPTLFDGDYNSLTNQPTIPSGNQIIDWTVSQGATNIHQDNYVDWAVNQGSTYIHSGNFPASVAYNYFKVAQDGVVKGNVLSTEQVNFRSGTNATFTVTNFSSTTATHEVKLDVANTQWDDAYTHSQAVHAPATAEANVQSDWNATSGDALILNKPTLASGTVTGTGTDNYVPMWNAAGTGLEDSTARFSSTGTALGLGKDPAFSLDVLGAANFDNNIFHRGALARFNMNNAYDGHLRVSGNTSGQFDIDVTTDTASLTYGTANINLKSGNVGIGSETPSDNLTVRNGTSDSTVKILSHNSAASTESSLKFSTIGTESGYTKGGITFRNTAGSFGRGDIHFLNDSAADSGDANTTNDTAMIIKQSGNVGIGTTSPDKLLELSKSVSGGQGATLRLTNSSGGSGAGTAVEFAGPGTQSIHAKIKTEDAGAYDSNLIFQTKATGTGGALADRLTIDNAGNVGIGKDDPQAKLHVQDYTTGESHQAMFKGGSVDIGDYSYISLNGGYISDYGKEVRLAAVSESLFGNKTGFAVLTSPDASGASGHERLRITADGNVGIGTTTPSSKLEVKGSTGVATSGGTLVVRQDGNTAADGIALTSSNSSSHRIWKDANGKLNIGSSSLPSSFVQDLFGNIGINDSTPSYKLDVNGTGRFTGTLRSDKFLQITGAGTTVNQANGIGANHTDDFAYVGNDSTTRYLNHYGMGLHKPIGSSITGANGAYMSGYFGLDLFTSGTNRLHIEQNGYIGIGTTTPTAKLAVVGLQGFDNNADAITGGLSVGDFYHFKGDLKVVT